ncbi:MAG: radical SAM protein [Planctomycetes bacterium]|nr:radical SAM protein [Planctomycetota bacterium]
MRPLNPKPPFIGCLHTQEHRYLYDVNTHRILRVPEETYQTVSEIVGHRTPLDRYLEQNPSGDPVIPALLDRGYLSPIRPKGVRPPLNREDLARLLDGSISQCTLELTQDCNQACRYCSYDPQNKGYRSHRDQTMSWSLAREAIDYFAAHSIEEKSPALGFYGGEPLLAWDLMKQCITYTLASFDERPLRINFTTNATLITDEIADFCAKNRVQILVSLDGPRALHDKYRIFKGSGDSGHEATLKGLSILNAHYGERYTERISLNAVFGPWTNLKETVSYFLKDAPDFVRALRVKLSAWSRVYGAPIFSAFDVSFLHLESFQHLEDKWFKALMGKEQITQQESDLLNGLFQDPYLRIYKEADNSMPEWLPIKGMCLPGLRKMFVDVDGRILPCERVGESNALTIGNINEGGVDSKKAMNILERIAKFFNGRCDDCIFCRICGGCAAQFIDIAGDLSEAAMEDFCSSMVKQCRRDLLNFILAQEQEPTCFDFMKDITIT